MSIINIEKLQNFYGKHIGIKDVTFSVNECEIFGFVGPNGAGKSTTIKVLMGIIFAQQGSAYICGLDVVKNIKEIKAFTGYAPSDVRHYNMYIKELLKRNAAFYSGDHTLETERLCSLFEIDVNKHFYELSTSNKKKSWLVRQRTVRLCYSPVIILLRCRSIARG